MSFGETITALAGIFFLFGLPAIIWHIQRMAQIKSKSGGQLDNTALSELLQLKAQMAELRDMTTRYDLSFDAALQRIESRVGNVESRVSSIEQETVKNRVTS